MATQKYTDKNGNVVEASLVMPGVYMDTQGNTYGTGDLTAYDASTATAAEEVPTINQEDWAKTSEGQQTSESQTSQWSGLPDWASALVAEMAGGGGEMEGLVTAINDLTASDALIEQQRVLQNQQYARDIQSPLMQSINSAVGQAAGRGVMDSSISSNWMKMIGGEAVKGALAQQNASNQWAAGEKVSALDKRVAAQTDYATLIGNLLLGTKESTSESTTSMQGTDSSYDPTAILGSLSFTNA